MSAVYTVAQLLASQATLAAAKQSVTVEDTAANISHAFGTLFADGFVRTIIVSDNGVVSLPPGDFFEALSPGLYGRVLTLGNANGSPVHIQAFDAVTVSQLLTDELKKIAPPSVLADTAANIANALATLNSDTHVTSIYVQDGGGVTLTAAQFLAETHALSEIVTTTALTVNIPSGSKGQTFVADDLNTTFNATGSTAESFVLHAGFGQDTINGYVPGSDSISVDHQVFASFAAMMTHAQNDGHGDVVITFSPSETLTLTNTTVAQLQGHSSDWHFI